MMRNLSIAVLLFLVTVMMSCSSPDGKITSDSKTEACEQNLLDALHAFSVDLGLPISIASEDAQTIFDKGEIQKKYARDGYQYTVYFGLEAGAVCQLVFYKRKQKGPGESSTTWGDYGTVDLPDCKCE